MAGTNSLEMEIHRLFQEGTSVEFVCRELVAKYEKSEVLSPSEIEGLSHFLITCGRLDLLRNLYIKTVQRSKTNVFPIGFFIEAIEKQNKILTNEIIDICEAALENQPYNSTALKSYSMRAFSQTALRQSLDIQKNFNNARLVEKNKLIEQLNHYRNSELTEQEEATLQKLMKLFPQDLEVGLLKQAHLEKKADEILDKVISQKNVNKPKFSVDFTDLGPGFIAKTQTGILQVAREIQNSQPEQLYNLAVMSFQAELYETCLEVLSFAPESRSKSWLMADALHESRRFLDLLQLLETIENGPYHDADATFAITYLRAQAYYGLGQIEKGISLLESLLQIKPVYRSAEALLMEWKSELKERS
ncbi:MAG: hypothetical protein ACK4VO_13830 [Pseudobdellovibrio sp.]